MKCVISCLVEFMKVVTETDTNSLLKLFPSLEIITCFLFHEIITITIISWKNIWIKPV